MRQLLDTLCIASSLALVALGGSDPTGGFYLRTQTIGRPLGNRGAHFGYGCRIPQYRWCVMRGVGWHVSLFLLCPFTASAEPSCFASSVATPRDYKAGDHSCATYILLHNLPSSPRLLPYGGCFLFFPSDPWRSWVGPHRKSHKIT
jgi:hypothetical protein